MNLKKLCKILKKIGKKYFFFKKIIKIPCFIEEKAVLLVTNFTY